MGTPNFSRTVLKGILDDTHYQVVAVVTQPDRPVGRKKTLTPSPVKELALAHNIPVFQPEKLSGSEEMKTLLGLEVDLLITAAYGQFVPTKLLKHPKEKAINVHASLLPKYRGGAPIHYAIWNGDKETGISIMYMEKEMDAGDILSQASTEIGPNEDVGQLFERLAVIGRDLLMETLPQLFMGQIQAQVQDLSAVTYSPTISKDQEKILWTQSAEMIHNHVRAFRPFPTTYTLFGGQRLKIWSGSPVEWLVKSEHSVGTIIGFEQDLLLVQAGQNSVYGIENLQPFGKKQMSAKDFVNGVGLDSLLGKILGQEA